MLYSRAVNDVERKLNLLNTSAHSLAAVMYSPLVVCLFVFCDGAVLKVIGRFSRTLTYSIWAREQLFKLILGVS